MPKLQSLLQIISAILNSLALLFSKDVEIGLIFFKSLQAS